MGRDLLPSLVRVFVQRYPAVQLDIQGPLAEASQTLLCLIAAGAGVSIIPEEIPVTRN